MEWTWRQQLYMLLQCGGVGFLLGMLYDLFTAVGRVKRFTRAAVFVSDVIFSVLSALITFYASLGIMDGQLHPLLFVGCTVGFAAQHGSVSRLFCRALTAVCSGISAFFHLVKNRVWRLFSRVVDAARSGGGKILEKCIKKRKKS